MYCGRDYVKLTGHLTQQLDFLFICCYKNRLKFSNFYFFLTIFTLYKTPKEPLRYRVPE